MVDKYAVIGNPVSHSKSPQIHRLFALQTGQEMSYEAILAPLDGFRASVDRLIKDDYKGVNVTLPFKFQAFQVATSLSARAQAARAVNTLGFRDHTVFGDNTDGAGLVRDIQANLAFPLKDRRVLLMGAGGAAYGVIPALLEADSRLSVVNRTFENAQTLAHDFAWLGKISVFRYEELETHRFDCVINATSSGIRNELAPLPESVFELDGLAYDMMYGNETPFMSFARMHGAGAVSDGLGMLVEQAAEAFLLWRGIRPETQPVIAELRKQ